ncbi:MAG: helix-hairpin-helix domain-containing protein [Andreesenia angusta]|nr:helix-hairpin-helix domain-containing protein [Andreesenia angusta]
MKNFTKNKQIAILILGLISVFFYFKMSDRENEIEAYQESELKFPIDDKKSIEKDDSQLSDNSYNLDSIIVDVKGAVNNPGIVHAREESRIIDIIELAGGFTENADMNSVNLAKIVEDEEMIYIPNIGENLEIREELIQNNLGTDSDKKTININSATKEELMELDGVGEATANKIIEYREEKKFESIEDIMQVNGIGEKKFESLKDYIKVR